MTGVGGIVLDVDDTLYLEREYVRSGFMHIDFWLTTQHGITGVGSKAWQLFKAGVRNSTIGDALEAVVGETSMLERCVHEYRNHHPAISLMPDAVRFLHSIGQDVRVAVVTDGPASSQRAKCRALGLYDWVERVVVTHEMGTSKPDPAVFAAAVEGWDLPAHELVYIADNPAKDFIAPLALGWQAVRVRRPGSLHHPMATPQGVLEVMDLSLVKCQADA